MAITVGGTQQDEAARLRALKNAVIGNLHKKVALTHDGTSLAQLVHYVVRAVENEDISEDDMPVLVQAVTILGSLSLPSVRSLKAFLNADVPSYLLKLLHLLPRSTASRSSQADKLAEAVLRSIKTLSANVVRVIGPSTWGSSSTGISLGEDGKEKDEMLSPEVKEQAQAFIDLLFADATLPILLAPLLKPDAANPQVITLLCTFLSATVRHEAQQMAVAKLSAVKSLAKIVQAGRGQARELALEAITAVARENSPMAWMLNSLAMEGANGEMHQFVDIVNDALYSSIPALRLAAATCRAAIWKAGGSRGSIKQLLPVLLSLMNSSGRDFEVMTQAAFTLGYLVTSSETLQTEFCALKGLDAVFELAKKQPWEGQPYKTAKTVAQEARLRESLLLILASLALTAEEPRKALLNSPLLPTIIQSLSHTSPRVRIAACHCIRGLSRSVGVLKTALVDHNATEPIWELLRSRETEGSAGEDPDIVMVRPHAVAAVCNLVLEFSPLRQSLIDKGCIDEFCRFVVSSDPVLQINAIWALKNVTYGSTNQVKRLTAASLSWSDFLALMRTASPDVASQAIGILRNLACTSAEDSTDPLPDSEELFSAVARAVSRGPVEDGAAFTKVANTPRAYALLDFVAEEELMSLFELKTREGTDEKVLAQAMWTTVNVATTGEVCKNAIAHHMPLVSNIVKGLSHTSSEIRTAAAWCIANLTSREANLRLPYDRINILRSLGAEEKLRTMLVDETWLDVRERVRDALENL